MPLLDVTDVLDDPDFQTTISVTRNALTVVDGYGTVSPTTTPDIGAVVIQGGNQELQRLPEGERISGLIVVYTRFGLTAGEGGDTADIVTWKSKAYTVRLTDDWSEYGQGYIAATCTLLPLNP